MVGFAINRTAQAIPLMLLVVLLEPQFTPGDPVHAMVGEYRVPYEFRATIENRYHFSDPLASRLIQYFGDLLPKCIYDGKNKTRSSTSRSRSIGVRRTPGCQRMRDDR